MGMSTQFVGSAQDDLAETTVVLNGTVFISTENLLNSRKFHYMFEKDVY